MTSSALRPRRFRRPALLMAAAATLALLLPAGTALAQALTDTDVADAPQAAGIPQCDSRRAHTPKTLSRRCRIMASA